MTLPDTTITVTDGALGNTPTTTAGGRLLLGVATMGGGQTANSLRTFYSLEDVKTYLVSGPLADAVGHELTIAGGPVHAVPITASVSPVAGSVTLTGTSPVSTVTATAAKDSYDVIIQVVLGGTLGTMTFKYSLDGGNTYSNTITSTSGTPWAYTLLDPVGVTTGVVFNFAAGTYYINDTYTFRVYEPSGSATNYTDALTVAINDTTTTWSFVHAVGANTTSSTDATNVASMVLIYSAMDTYMGTAFSAFRFARCMCDAPDIYAGGSFTDAWDTAFIGNGTSTGVSTLTLTRTGVAAGHCNVVSPINGLVKRRPSGFIASPMIGALIKREQEFRSIGCPGDPGAAPGVLKLWRDDAVTSKKLYDNRIVALRTIRGANGFYFGGAPTLTSGTSDFKFYELGMVIDKATSKVREKMVTYINSSVNVNTNGTIYEADATAIENDVERALLDYLSGQISVPPVDFKTVTIDRTNNITSTGILKVKVRIIAKGYARTITIDMGFNAVKTSSV